MFLTDTTQLCRVLVEFPNLSLAL